MKFSNPKGSDLKDTIILVIGISAGVMAGRAAHAAATGMIEAPSDGVKLGIRAGILGASGIAAAGIKGSDDLSKTLKNVALGSALIQVIDGTKEAVAGNAKIAALANGTKTEKIVAKSLGLACPCESSEALMALPLNRPNRRRRLNSPALVEAANSYSDNYLQNALNVGASVN